VPSFSTEVDREGSGFGGQDSGISQFRRLAAAAGGKMTILKHLDGMALSAADLWGPPGPEIRVMQAIKDRFDPKNILNPGRFVY
jgi:glycolate oxidase FAD binding subunit